MRGRDTQRHPVTFLSSGVRLRGERSLPAGATGLVLFAHDSGNRGSSARSHALAQILEHAGIGTLIFDLLSPDEARVDALTQRLRFDIALLAHRVVGAVDWVATDPRSRGLRIGVFGEGTGAAAALLAAASRPRRVAAVVSDGGRPDLAGRALGAVRAPTLFLVGGLDTLVLGMTRHAQRRMRARSRLEIVEGVGHRSNEPEALDEAATMATRFFREHLVLPADIHPGLAG